MKKPSKKRVKARRVWVINPRTRVVKSKRIYTRKKERQAAQPRTFLAEDME